MWDKLFQLPLSDEIKRNLPTLFDMVELVHRRKGKLGMEVGNAREDILIALLIHAYGEKSVEFASSTAPEVDAILNGLPVSIKTKSGTGYSGIKISWTANWDASGKFADSFTPSSDLLYVNIRWGYAIKGFFLIPNAVQIEALEKFGRAGFFKILPRETNPRGVELAGNAMKYMQEHKDTLSMDIDWQRDLSLPRDEGFRYQRWIKLWNELK